jgi:hypothetical protein
MAAESFEEALDALRNANPIPEPDESGTGELGDSDLSRLAAIIGNDTNTAEDTAKLDSLAEHRRRGFRKITATAVITVALLSTAAWAVIHRAASADPTSVLCLNQARTFQMPETSDPPLQGAQLSLHGDPALTCSQAWTRPMFEQPAQPPPPLATCVLPSGILAVLPGKNQTVCDEIGLARWTGQFRDDPSALTALADHLVAWLGEHPCATGTEAAQLATGELATGRLARWKVEAIEQPTSGMNCAGLGIDFSKRTISITFWPGK